MRTINGPALDPSTRRRSSVGLLEKGGAADCVGVNIQILADASGFPLWVSDGPAGSTHDLSAARILMLPQLFPHTALHRPDRIDVLADKAHTSVGAGVHTPYKRDPRMSEGADPDRATYSQLITSLRAIAEGANAMLTQRWHALRYVTLDPAAVGIITAAALTLVHLERRWPSTLARKPQ